MVCLSLIGGLQGQPQSFSWTEQDIAALKQVEVASLLSHNGPFVPSFTTLLTSSGIHQAGSYHTWSVSIFVVDLPIDTTCSQIM